MADSPSSPTRAELAARRAQALADPLRVAILSGLAASGPLRPELVARSVGVSVEVLTRELEPLLSAAMVAGCDYPAGSVEPRSYRLTSTGRRAVRALDCLLAES